MVIVFHIFPFPLVSHYHIFPLGPTLFKRGKGICVIAGINLIPQSQIPLTYLYISVVECPLISSLFIITWLSEDFPLSQLLHIVCLGGIYTLFSHLVIFIFRHPGDLSLVHLWGSGRLSSISQPQTCLLKNCPCSIVSIQIHYDCIPLFF